MIYIKKLFLSVSIFALAIFVFVGVVSAKENQNQQGQHGDNQQGQHEDNQHSNNDKECVKGWNVTGTYVIDYIWNGSDYPNDVTLVQTGNTFTGTMSWPTGSPTVHGVVSGTVTGNAVTFTVQYDDRLYLRDDTGTIALNGVSGTWSDQTTVNSGTWVMTVGKATQVKRDCDDNDKNDRSEGEKEWKLVNTVTVPANNPTATLSSISLGIGKKFKLVASGTWDNTGKNTADAEYASIDSWVTHMAGYNIAPYLLGPNEFDLQVNNTFVDWGSYNSSHTYTRMYTGTGSPVSFLIFDGESGVVNPGWYGDNVGSLTVKIYANQ